MQTPIPASTYNEQYFTGVTSNYTNGYEWDNIGQLFLMMSRFLTGALFPDATTFLDFGAARGFCVRALRDLGKVAWGVEHSPWCLAHADAVAQPYLVPMLADLPTTQRYDVVTAFETLEHLTTAQLAEILPALRCRTGQALFATIPCTDMPHKRARAHADKDPTHLSIYPRAWWYEQFATAGFEVGPWQRLAERLCHQHPVVQYAGLNIFICGGTA